jgi:hypothetical protein
MRPLSQCSDPYACPDCEKPTKKLVTQVGVIFKGDGWASKNGRVARQMREKNRRLAGKEDEMRREAPGMALVPNVGGERVESWSDATRLAKSKGKQTGGYEKLARKEKQK